MSYLRRAGHGRLADGRLVTWSLAEGARGRRWRWTIAAGEGTLEHAGLIELAAARRFVRLELEAVAGMLTLHPDGDGLTAHGNIVRADRVDPIAVPWTWDSGIRFVRDPFASALLLADGQQVTIASDLSVSIGSAADRDAASPGLDVRGVPRLIDPREWPLEV